MASPSLLKVKEEIAYPFNQRERPQDYHKIHNTRMFFLRWLRGNLGRFCFPILFLWRMKATGKLITRPFSRPKSEFSFPSSHSISPLMASLKNKASQCFAPQQASLLMEMFQHIQEYLGPEYENVTSQLSRVNMQSDPGKARKHTSYIYLWCVGM